MFTCSVRRVFALVRPRCCSSRPPASRRHKGRPRSSGLRPTRECSPRTPVRWRASRRAPPSRPVFSTVDADEAGFGWRTRPSPSCSPIVPAGSPTSHSRPTVSTWPSGTRAEPAPSTSIASRVAPSWANWSPRSTRRGSCASRRTRSSPRHRPELWLSGGPPRSRCSRYPAAATTRSPPHATSRRTDSSKPLRPARGRSPSSGPPTARSCGP